MNYLLDWTLWRSHPSLQHELREAAPGRDISLGHRAYETAKVDCRYLSNESKWGLLNGKRVFLLCLDLAFRQPRGYRLFNVEVKLSFTEHSGASATGASRLQTTPQLVLNVAPSNAQGPPIQSRTASLTSWSSVVTQHSAVWSKHLWTLTGYADAESNDLGLYTDAVWRWDLNLEDEEVDLNEPLHVGLLVEHDLSPFIAGLTISGQLSRYGKVYKLGGSIPATRTRFQPLEPSLSREDFEALAQSLNEVVTRKNAPRQPSTASTSNPRAISPSPALRRAFTDIPEDGSHRSSTTNPVGTDSPSKKIVFLDDDERHDPSKIAHADLWFGLYDDFLDTEIMPVLDALLDIDDSESKGRRPVKIAVLDTGIDREHPIIHANSERIIRDKDWVGDGKGTEDTFGHGTHTAAFLLQLAPNAHIYVARIAKDKYMASEEHVVQAIEWAITCGVDIISMSFGLPYRNDKIHRALRKAESAGIVMFAAAANDGGNKGVAYPAKHPIVIGVYSVDGKGNRSDFSPSPLRCQYNFATLGDCLASSFRDEAGNRGDVRKSGTSYATPVAAAIAATVLDYARLKMDLSESALSRLFSSDGVKGLFKLMAEDGSEKRDGYDYVAPWHLWIEGRPDSHVHSLIEEMIRTLP